MCCRDSSFVVMIRRYDRKCSRRNAFSRVGISQNLGVKVAFRAVSLKYGLAVSIMCSHDRNLRRAVLTSKRRISFQLL